MPNDPTETNSAQGETQATDAMLQRIEEIDVELAAYIKMIQQADETTFAAMSAQGRPKRIASKRSPAICISTRVLQCTPGFRSGSEASIQQCRRNVRCTRAP
jgi:hypothetical protein